MDEVNSREQNGEKSVLDHMIRERIAAFSAKRGRNVICYYSSWLQKPNRDDTGINDLDMNGFMNAVKDMDRSPRSPLPQREIGPVRQQSSSVRAVCDAGRGRISNQGADRSAGTSGR